jgi:hypothetical protein
LLAPLARIALEAAVFVAFGETPYFTQLTPHTKRVHHLLLQIGGARSVLDVIGLR